MGISVKEWIATIDKHGLLAGGIAAAMQTVFDELAGKKVKITVELYQKKRSTNQNSYYWGVVIPAITCAFREHGNNVDDEDVHDFLKMRVGKLAQVFVTPDGEVMKGLGSTKRLTTTEFEAYLEKVRAWAAENLEISIALPNE